MVVDDVAAGCEGPVLKVLGFEVVHLDFGKPVVPAISDVCLEVQLGVLRSAVTGVVDLHESGDGHVDVNVEYLKLVGMPTDEAAIAGFQDTCRSLERHVER